MHLHLHLPSALRTSFQTRAACRLICHPRQRLEKEFTSSDLILCIRNSQHNLVAWLCTAKTSIRGLGNIPATTYILVLALASDPPKIEHELCLGRTLRIRDFGQGFDMSLGLIGCVFGFQQHSQGSWDGPLDFLSSPRPLQTMAVLRRSRRPS